MSTEISWNELLDTWFGDSRDDPARIGPRMGWWFQADDGRDAELDTRYRECCETAMAGGLGAWQEAPHPRLALILLLDQLPRNLFRGSARAFQCDDRAAMLCLAGIAAGMDRDLLPIERVFFYMPLQHTEDLAAQDVSVGLFQALAEEPSAHPVFQGCADYARRHRDIVARFGRFPHRNETLGRVSTADEKEYLASGGERFGQ